MAHKDNIKNAENAAAQVAKAAQAAADGTPIVADGPEVVVPAVKSVNEATNRTGAVQIWPKVEPKAEPKAEPKTV